MKRSVKTSVLSIAVAAGLSMAAPMAHADVPLQYHPLTPCRLIDTRNGAGAMTTNQDRTFAVQGVCGVPSGAKAVSLNVTAVGPTGAGFLTLYPSGISKPLVSTVNFVAGDQAVANGAIVPVGDGPTFPNADVHVFAGLSGTVHLILDVSGYFQ